MSLNPRTVDASTWGPPIVGVGALERELTRLRRADRAEARENQIVARTSVLNLVVFARREIHALRAARTIAELALRHPSRAIVLRTDHAHGDAPAIATHCTLPRSDHGQLCYEQILVRASGRGIEERLPSMVMPLLLADLPVFLWWTDTPPFDDPHFADLFDLADRLLIDSSDFARPDQGLPKIAEICRGSRGRRGVTDFNWTRLTAWRELLASIFDVPLWQPFLQKITGLRIGFTVDADGREIHPSQALLLLGWLASLLNWRATETLAPSEAGGMLFAMQRADGQSIRVRVRPRFERNLEEGDLSGIAMQASHDGHAAEFRVRRGPSEGHVTTSVDLDGRIVVERTVPLRRPRVVDLLGEELTIVGSDHVYEASLAKLVALT